jgi:N-acetylglutamate synthase-like GNAT family acetyltransferase
MSYEYLVHRNLSKKQVIDRYEPFTFPSFLQKSKVRQLQEPFFVVEVMYEKERIGLAVLELLPKNSLLKVLSLYVKEEYRKRGVATQILKIAERVAINNQLAILNIIFQNNWESFKIMPKLLKNLGWNEPEKRMILVKLSYQQIADAKWFKVEEYPPNLSVHRWVDLSEEDYAYIRKRKKEENWFEDDLSPFQLADILVATGSLVLKNENGAVVGWLIVHRAAPRTVQFTSYFIDENYRKTPATFNLLADSIQRMRQADEGDDAIFMFKAANEKMMFFAKAIVGEHNTGAFTEVWVSHKKVV